MVDEMETKGSIFVVGMGPGALDKMTIEAKNVLEQCDLIVGYTVYTELLKDFFPEKEYLSTPMRREVERCTLCYEKAREGYMVALVCSGDAGVYGMSGLILQLSERYPNIPVVVIPGTTAALSGGAVLGAPLTHDFAVISLSDLLTPLSLIERRIKAAVYGDFAICIYNPSSHKRKDYLKMACDWMLQADPSMKDRVCGIVRQIGRAEETMEICSLAELREKQVDMFTTVFIGNSMTTIIQGRMVTPRGYRMQDE